MWSCTLIFFFSLSAFPIQKEDNPKLQGTTVVRVSYSKKKKMDPELDKLTSKKTWWSTQRSERLRKLLHAGPACLRKVVIFFFFFAVFAGKRICGPIQFPPGGCHGSFSLTFSVCANQQLQTDGADDAANSLRNSTQYSGVCIAASLGLN